MPPQVPPNRSPFPDGEESLEQPYQPSAVEPSYAFDPPPETSNTPAIQTPDIKQIGVEHVRAMWVHRRRMAYTALSASLLIVFVVLGTTILGADRVVENMSKFEAFLITAFMTLIGLVGAYMGLATIADVKQDVFKLRR